MTPPPSFIAVVGQDGRMDLAPHERQRLSAYMGSLKGQRIEVVVKPYRAQRSSQQNRYYHGVVVALLAEHCGYDHDDMHEALAMKFLRIEDCPVTGAPRRLRTPKADTKQFADYLDACIRLAAEHGVVIPEPNEVTS